MCVHNENDINNQADAPAQDIDFYVFEAKRN